MTMAWACQRRWPAALAGSGSGFGLQQIRERLASRYGGAARFDLTADSAGGTRACIVLPLKSQP
jgi:sensor histidine kinase YesM